MIDTEEVNRRVDLLELVNKFTLVKFVASTQGGEYAGPCPFCTDHGQDRFRVQPKREPLPRWMCHVCTDGQWQDAISLGRRLWPEMNFAEVCERLVGQVPSGKVIKAQRKNPLAYQPLGESFEKDGQRAIEICQRNLWQDTGEAALSYLRSRGLMDKTIKNFRLGYSQGAQFGQTYVPCGIVIPCVVSGELWYLKISLLPGQVVKCAGCGGQVPARVPCVHCGKENKYQGVKGNRPAAIFNADWLGGVDFALFCEGEFDTMIAHQELNDVLPCVTMGSAGNRLDLAAWGRYLLPLKHMLVAYDSDAAGKVGTAAFERMTSRVHPLALPNGVKDINEWSISGANLWNWIRPILDEIDPLPKHNVPSKKHLDAIRH